MSDRPPDENDLNLSSTVDKARKSLADQGSIPAWSLAAAILTRHSEYTNRDVDEVLTRGQERIDPDAQTAKGANTPEKESTSKMPSQETPFDAESEAAAPEFTSESITTKSVTEWLLEVQQMYRNTSQSPYLHGRRVLLGLAITDETVRDILKHESFLNSLVKETTDFEDAVSVNRWWDILGVDRPIQREKTPLLDDRPIDNPEHDFLNRQAFAAYLASLIDEAATRGDLEAGAYAIHLSGDWGVGKTSILNFLKDELEGSPATQPPGSETEGDQSVTTDARWKGVLEQAWKGLRSMWPSGGATGREQARDGDDAQWTVIRFNAWQNQHIDPPWWALVDQVYQESRPKLRPTVILREVLWRWSWPRLVRCQSSIEGYSRRNLIRASSDVNRQSMSVSSPFSELVHAATSSRSVAALGIRRSRHCCWRRLNSISAILSQLPWTGVKWNSSLSRRRRASSGSKYS